MGVRPTDDGEKKRGTLRASHHTAAERIQQPYGWRGQPQLRYSPLFFAALQTRFSRMRMKTSNSAPPNRAATVKERFATAPIHPVFQTSGTLQRSARSTLQKLPLDNLRSQFNGHVAFKEKRPHGLQVFAPLFQRRWRHDRYLPGSSNKRIANRSHQRSRLDIDAPLL